MEKVKSTVFIERDIPKKKKRRLSKLGKLITVVFFLTLAVTFYFVAFAKINNIKVSGNTFLTDEYILNCLDISTSDPVIKALINKQKNKLKNEEIIDDIVIEIHAHQCISVQVKEKKIIGWQQDDAGIQLITSDGNYIPFQTTYVNNYYLLPYFVNIDKEKALIIASKFAQLDNDILYRISEVHNLSFTYDSNMVKLVMDEGNYIYSSLEGIPYVKNYLQIIANDRSENNKCILIMEEYNKALKTSCEELEKYKSENKEE
ncbi:MAG: FtsQ-type POTRA domain-containing protein [Erysipelotrichia bacterium]|nr:FtsQ-type POTRA domain-containing protein [Erysipelotrichia bacterium]